MRSQNEIWGNINTDEAKVKPYELPSPLKASSGELINNSFDWMNFRRREIKSKFENIMYGKIPRRSDILHFELLTCKQNALNHRAIRKEIRIHAAMNNGASIHFDLLLYLPANVDKTSGVFLALNHRSNISCTEESDIIQTEAPVILPGDKDLYAESKADPTLQGCVAKQWGINELIDHNFAFATIYSGELFPEYREGFEKSIFKLFYSPDELKSPSKNFGAISAWAWGLSRGLEALQNEPMINPDKILLYGHSRYGKTALWAGACDERFAGVISNCSGCCGAALNKRNFGENLEWLLYWRPHWFNTELAKYINQEKNLPFDQHELLSLIAPRPLYVISAAEDKMADPKGEFLSFKAAEKVYQLFGIKPTADAVLPPVDSPIGEKIRYHLRQGDHSPKLYDWQQCIKFAESLML